MQALSISSGNKGGQFLNITGSGFSANLLNNTVSVDNNPCQVTASSGNLISCTLAKRNPSLTSKISTTSTNQSNPFISGSGWQYTRYDLTDLSYTTSSLRTDLLAGVSIPIL